MKNLFLVAGFVVWTVAAQADEPAIGEVTITHTALEGIGAEAGVMRRDPSDIIKVGDLFYVWYSKGKIAPGYDADFVVWSPEEEFTCNDSRQRVLVVARS